jgi:TatD DNase family protein
MFVDTHTHFYDEWLLPEADEAVRRALEAGVGKFIQADVDSHERPAMWDVARRYPGVIYNMLGLYPGSVNENWREEMDLVYSLADRDSRNKSENDDVLLKIPGQARNDEKKQARNDEKKQARNDEKKQARNDEGIVAIGEIGLDYHEGREFEKEQREVLRLQFELAAKMDLPVNIHLRDAWEDFFAVLEDCRHLHLRGDLHCFSGSYEVYQRANRSGDFSVGIGGVITFKNSGLAATVARIPMEHILLETDAPYLAPVPYRGKRNESAYLPIIAEKVAEVKGVSVKEIEEVTTNNAFKLFNIQ